MKKINIGLVVRTYDKTGNFNEARYDNISCTNIPEDVLKNIVEDEVICIQLMPDVEAFYFKVPNDWPENWVELGRHNDK